MKLILSAAAIVAALSTPALAEKTLVDPKQETKNLCSNDKMEWMIIYHLDQIETLIDQMRKETLSVGPPYPKPVNNNKKS